MKAQWEVEVLMYLYLTSALCGVGGGSDTSAASFLGKRSSAHFTGGWVGLTAALDGRGRFLHHWR